MTDRLDGPRQEEKRAGMLYTKKALGKALGLTAGEIETLTKTGVIAHEKGETYRLESAAREIIGFYKAKAEKTPETTYEAERALLMRARRMDYEYNLRQREKKLHESEDIEQIMGTMLLNFRARIMAIPAKLTTRLAKENNKTKVYELLKEATDDALNELSDYDQLFGDEGE